MLSTVSNCRGRPIDLNVQVMRVMWRTYSLWFCPSHRMQICSEEARAVGTNLRLFSPPLSTKYTGFSGSCDTLGRCPSAVSIA